ncbi:MAG TPA: Flp pilus assembly protein CpaB [Motilibacteraceae bacterium]|nr:Flp pilus assembly protein CpaB [Motilibacteraceae bacterium]
MNPRQRRGVLLLVLALLTGVATFAAVLRYVAGVDAEVGPRRDVLALAVDAPAWQPITAQMLRTVEVPDRWLPGTAVTSPADVVGKVPPADIPAGSMVQRGMIVDPPTLTGDQRAVTLLLDDEAALAGALDPGSVVDVDATYGGNGREPGTARTVATSVRVMRVEKTRNQGYLVTFAATAEQTLSLSHAQSFAKRLRLVLRPPGGAAGPAPQPVQSPGQGAAAAPTASPTPAPSTATTGAPGGSTSTTAAAPRAAGARS